MSIDVKRSSEESEEEKDNIPLSVKLKMMSNQDNKETYAASEKYSKGYGDFDDEDEDDIPLSVRLLRNSNARTFCSNNDNSSVQKKCISHGEEKNVKKSKNPHLDAQIKTKLLSDLSTQNKAAKRSYSKRKSKMSGNGSVCSKLSAELDLEEGEIALLPPSTEECRKKRRIGEKKNALLGERC